MNPQDQKGKPSDAQRQPQAGKKPDANRDQNKTEKPGAGNLGSQSPYQNR